MGKVKKSSKTIENVSETPKKTRNYVQLIKSPKLKKKSIVKQKKSSKKDSLQTNHESEKKITQKTKLNKTNTSAILKEKFNIKVEDVKAALETNHESDKKIAPKTKLKKTNTSAKLKDFEEKFNIKIKDVKAALEGAIQLHLQNPKVKNQLFDEKDFPISLIIGCHKIPSGHQRILRIPLIHTLVTPDDDICLIVSEVKGIGNKEHDKQVEHYENFLAQKGITNIKKIMTVHELKTEYETYEQKRRLVDLYERFLVCAKVSGKVVKKCGKIFYTRRKVPTSIKLQATKLKEHIDKQLSKAFCHLHLKGNCYNIEFGNSLMNTSKLIENFVSVVEYLNKEFPGGFNNINGLHITASRSSSIPVYISTKNPTEIPAVKIQTTNKLVQKSVKDELTTQLNAEVLVKPSGQVTVIREKRPHTENNKTDGEDNIARKKLKSQKIVDQAVKVKVKNLKNGKKNTTINPLRKIKKNKENIVKVKKLKHVNKKKSMKV